MRALMGTIIVFSLLNSVTTSFAMVEKAEVEADHTGAKADAPAAREAYAESLTNVEPEIEQWTKSIVLAATSHYSGVGRVLVIPTEETRAQDIITIMEDLSVMSRILDKKLLEARMISGAGYGGRGGYGGYGGHRRYQVSVPFGGDGRLAEGIYVDGYGALFLMRVGFPLSAPPETKEEKETEEPTDRIWQETRQEIFTSPDVIKRRGIRLRSDREDKYDAEKVEDLKRGLIKSLRHAANIRNLEPDEWVILTVIGEGALSGEVGRCGSCHHGDNTESEAGQNGCPSATVMTVRVEKSDVDDFSEGELSLDERG
jgi:hypothetical protein